MQVMPERIQTYRMKPESEKTLLKKKEAVFCPWFYLP